MIWSTINNISNEKEYVVNGAILTCDKAKRESVKVKIGNSIVEFEGNNSASYKYTRLKVEENGQNSNGLYIATVGDTVPDVPYKGVKLWNRESGANATYSMPILDEVECISDETLYNNIGNRIVKLVLDREKIKPYAVFRINGYKRNCIVGRMDFVESILRRGAIGIKLTLL